MECTGNLIALVNMFFSIIFFAIGYAFAIYNNKEIRLKAVFKDIRDIMYRLEKDNKK